MAGITKTSFTKTVAVPTSQVPTHASRCPRPLVHVPLLYTASGTYTTPSTNTNSGWNYTENGRRNSFHRGGFVTRLFTSHAASQPFRHQRRGCGPHFSRLIMGACPSGEYFHEVITKIIRHISQLLITSDNIRQQSSRINYARLHWIRNKKQTSNTIITQAYHSRCSSWKVSSKASIASDFATLLRIKQGENENDAIRNRISDFDKRRIS